MPLHRTQAIPETLEAVPNYGTLHIYKIPASRFWQARCWMANRQIKKSLKTEDKRKAIIAAIDFYDELRQRKKNNEPLTDGSSFKKVVEDLTRTDQLRVDRGEANPRLVKDQGYLLKKDILPFFQKTPITAVTFQKLTDYTERLRERNVGSNTIKWHFVVLRKILTHATKMNLLTHLPVFPKIGTKDEPREFFNSEQYKLLRETIIQAIKDNVIVRGIPITDELRYLVTFGVNTFTRPSDWKTLLVKEITIANQGEISYLRITPKSTKTGKNQPYISMPDAVGIFNDLQKFNEIRGFGKEDDFLFFPELKNRAYALQTFQRQFNWILNTAGLKKGNSGKNKTLYSLRHTGIHFRLINSENLDMITLAKSANTSVEMLQRFYLKGAEVERNIEKLHSFKKTTKVKTSKKQK